MSEVCVTHFDDVSYKQILAAPNYTVCIIENEVGNGSIVF